MTMQYHPIATTNTHIRTLIQESKESSYVLAARFTINRKTVLKWKHRTFVSDAPRGTQSPRRRLTQTEQKVIVKVRKHLKVTLDDLLTIVRPYIPAANRDNVYRILVRHKLNRLPAAFDTRKTGTFAAYLPGFIHIDLAYLPILQNTYTRRYLLVAIDRVTKLVYTMVVPGKSQTYMIRFVHALIAWLPYRIHRILTDNGRETGKQFTQECKSHGINHKRTKVKHPWTNGQVERTIQTIKEETVRAVFYASYLRLEEDIVHWQYEYNTARKLKSLNGLTPYEKMIAYYESLTPQKQRQRFTKEPYSFLSNRPVYSAT